MAKTGNKKSNSLNLIVLLGIGLAVVFAGWYLLTRKTAPATVPLQGSGLASVTLTEPSNGATLTTWQPIVVSALALGPIPFTSIELWVDGALASIQAAPSGGTSPLAAGFNWLPKQAGTYTLVARATQVDGESVTSAQVVVLVAENETPLAELPVSLQDAAEFLPGIPAGSESPAPLVQPTAAGSTPAATQAGEGQAPQQPMALKILGLHFDTDPELAYCYRAINADGWERWPLDGFFESDEEGAFAKDELIQVLSGDEGIDVQLQCWGWLGGALDFLGGQEFHVLSGDGPLFFQDAGFAVELESGLQSLIDLLPSYDQYMPRVVAATTFNPFDCPKHTPPEWETQEFAGFIVFFCEPQDGLHQYNFAGDETDLTKTQHYLIWDTVPCNSVGCISYAEWLEKAEQEGGRVGFEFQDNSTTGDYSGELDIPRMTVFAVPYNYCSGYRTFKVRMFYDQPGHGRAYGPYSNQTGMYCYDFIGSEIVLDIEIKNVTIVEPYSDHELFGYFAVDPFAGSNQYVNISTFNKKASQCPAVQPQQNDPSFSSDVLAQFYFGCPQFLELGNNPQNPTYMCQSTKVGKCTLGGFHLANNIIRVHVPEGFGFSVRFSLFLYEDDHHSPMWCTGLSTPQFKPIVEWQALTPDYEETIQASAGLDTNCSVDFAIHPVPQP